MTELQEKQLQILAETVAAYNSNTRCVEGSGACMYHVEGKQGCAVGRLLDEATRKTLKEGKRVGYNFESLPKDIQELGLDFLSALQTLHDNSHNWDETGLTSFGKEFVEHIKAMITVSFSKNLTLNY